MEITIKVYATGNFTESELAEYALFQLGSGGCSMNNPFVSDDGDAEITSAEIA